MSKIAFVFPGQGSQSVGMLAAAAAEWSVVRSTFDAASEAVGVDLWQLSQQGPEAELNRTANTQPALLAAGVALWRVWREADGVRPDYLAGHSLGEYTALVCAGSLSLADAARLVAARGRYMQEAVAEGEGTMAAIIGLDDAAVETLCEEAGASGGVVSAANFNAPGQVVIAGDNAAVERALVAARDQGARRVMPLSVSVPSHCELMKPAAQRLRAALADTEIDEPELPIVHNVDVHLHRDPVAIRQALEAQLYRPVRWTGTVAWLVDAGVGRFGECGPGKVLSGLIKRGARSADIAALEDPETLRGRATAWSEA